MQLRKVIENRMFPHVLTTFQWSLLVICLAFNLNFSVTVTGSVANGGLKVIMLFHLWMLFFPAVLCVIFYRGRREGITERCIIGLLMATILFSMLNISLHFVNDFVLLMKGTEVVAWCLYNSIFSLALYKISDVILLPVVRKIVIVKKETLRGDKELWAQSQNCEGRQ